MRKSSTTLSYVSPVLYHPLAFSLSLHHRIAHIGPTSCAIDGLGSVIVHPNTIIVGINPQCNAVFAYGTAFCQALSAAAIASDIRSFTLFPILTLLVLFAYVLNPEKLINYCVLCRSLIFNQNETLSTTNDTHIHTRVCLFIASILKMFFRFI